MPSTRTIEESFEFGRKGNLENESAPGFTSVLLALFCEISRTV
jgi:hypothetical protein